MHCCVVLCGVALFTVVLPVLFYGVVYCGRVLLTLVWCYAVHDIVMLSAMVWTCLIWCWDVVLSTVMWCYPLWFGADYSAVVLSNVVLSRALWRCLEWRGVEMSAMVWCCMLELHIVMISTLTMWVIFHPVVNQSHSSSQQHPLSKVRSGSSSRKEDACRFSPQRIPNNCSFSPSPPHHLPNGSLTSSLDSGVLVLLSAGANSYYCTVSCQSHFIHNWQRC